MTDSLIHTPTPEEIAHVAGTSGDAYLPGESQVHFTKEGILYSRGKDVVKKEITWFMKPYIARIGLTIFAGMQGVGKGHLLASIISAVTRGATFPTRDPAPEEGVIILNVEDSPEYVQKARLERYGADERRYVFIRGVKVGNTLKRRFDLKADLSRMKEMLDGGGYLEDKSVKPSAIIIDPLSSYWPEEYDTFKDTEVREVLEPWAELAEHRSIALIGVMHFSKATQTNALHKIKNSGAFTELARTVIALAEDPSNPVRRVFGHLKENLDVGMESRGYLIGSNGYISFEPYLADPDVGMILEGYGRDGEEEKPRDAAKRKAKDAIIEVLKERGRLSGDELREIVMDRTGVSKATFYRALDELQDSLDVEMVGKVAIYSLKQ